MKIRYFDNAATTKVKEEVLKEMVPYLSEQYGNPSSLYSLGRNSKRAIEQARRRVANLINANVNEIYFTGCGSESDNMIIKGIAKHYKNKGKHIITSCIEHPAVLQTCKQLEKQGFQVSYIGVDNEGKIKLDELENSIKKDTILMSIMFANNEIGTLQPIKLISTIAKKHDIIFHTDAVQACGNVFIDVQNMGIDCLSLSGHKLYAPKGVGALYVKNGIDFDTFMNGGHQEKNKRAGTENVASIVGLGKACELAKQNLQEHIKHLEYLREYFITQIEQKIPQAKLNGARHERLPGNANFSFPNIEGEKILFKLDEKGICASIGSACTSGSTTPSHVLTAIGLSSEFAKGTLRVTFGEDNTKEDVDFLVKQLVEILNNS